MTLPYGQSPPSGGGGAPPATFDPNQYHGGLPGLADQGAEGQKPAGGSQAAKQGGGLGRMGQLLDAAVNYFAQVIRGGADSARQALAGLVQSLSSSLLPAPFGGWVGTLLGAFIGRDRAIKVTPADGSMPIHFSTRADYGLDVNVISAVLSGRVVWTTPAQPSVELVMNYQEGVEDVIATKVAQSANRATMRPARRRLGYGY